MSLHLDTLAYTNRLRNIPSELKIGFSIINLIISVLSHPPTQIIIALWMIFCTLVYARIPMRVYLRLLTVASFFLMMSLPALIINITTNQQLPSLQADLWQGFYVGNLYIYFSRSGIQQAFTIFTRSFASISCLYFLILSVPFNQILEVLRRLGLPPLITDLLLLMYRFIFVLLNTANQLWIAQNSRCGYRSGQRGIKSLALLIGKLLQRTLQQYQQFSQGLETRGFQGEFKVYNFQRDRNLALKGNYTKYAIAAIISWIILIILEIIYVRFYT